MLVPGTGFEPVFLGSEASVLPARRSRNASVVRDERREKRDETARDGTDAFVACGGYTSPSPPGSFDEESCSSRSGGDRTLTTPGKSRVRFQLRYGPVNQVSRDGESSERSAKSEMRRVKRVRSERRVLASQAPYRAQRARGTRTSEPVDVTIG